MVEAVNSRYSMHMLMVSTTSRTWQHDQHSSSPVLSFNLQYPGRCWFNMLSLDTLHMLPICYKDVMHVMHLSHNRLR
jgi:hypothetical protein